MKNMVSIFALSSALTTGVMAGNMYGSGGVALTSVSGYDSGVSLVLNGGMKMDEVYPNFVVEGEMTYSVVAPSLGSSLDLDIFNLGGYAGYHFTIPNTDITLKPRVGLNYENISLSNKNISVLLDDGGISLSYGIGVSMPLGNGMRGYVDFTDKGISNNLTAGVEIAL